jgi:hypothetical protein
MQVCLNLAQCYILIQSEVRLQQLIVGFVLAEIPHCIPHPHYPPLSLYCVDFLHCPPELAGNRLYPFRFTDHGTKRLSKRCCSWQGGMLIGLSKGCPNQKAVLVTDGNANTLDQLLPLWEFYDVCVYLEVSAAIFCQTRDRDARRKTLNW